MASRNVLCTALLSLLVLLSGCSGGGEGSYLPSGLDTNALAKTFEGTWLTRYEWAADPTGKTEISEEVHVFTLEPTVNQHGKYKIYRRRYVKGTGEATEFTSGGYGKWQLFAAEFGAIAAKNKGLYSATLNQDSETDTSGSLEQYAETAQERALISRTGSYSLTEINGKQYVAKNNGFGGGIKTYVKVDPNTLSLPNQSSANSTATQPSTNQQADSPIGDPVAGQQANSTATNKDLPEQNYLCEVQISHFKVACLKYFFAKKKFPSSIDELKPFLDKQRVPSDPWGNAYRYQLDTEKDQATITSSGSDGQFDTADDVSGIRTNPNNEVVDDVIINDDKN